MKPSLAVFGLIALSMAGCGTPGPKREAGPQGTVAYYVQVETSEPGARIEADGNYVGKSPLTVKIFGDKDGTFHNFGSPDYVIKAYPVRQGQYVQTKDFKTGGWFMPEDRIPSRIYLDMDLGPAVPTQQVNVNVNKNVNTTERVDANVNVK